MSATIMPFRPIDGPLAIAGERLARVEKMADALIAFETYGDEQEAVRSLYGNGYRMIEICLLLDDARQVAMQRVVAREMAPEPCGRRGGNCQCTSLAECIHS